MKGYAEEQLEIGEATATCPVAVLHRLETYARRADSSLADDVRVLLEAYHATQAKRVSDA